VDHAWHGRGIAQRLMQATIDEAAAAGATTVWLGVWEHNARAIAFYGKHGFVDVGSHEFLVGSDPQTDRVMVRNLDLPQHGEPATHKRERRAGSTWTPETPKAG